MELPNQPDGDRYVENDEQPVPGEKEEEENDQLEPELRNVPEVETAAAFLCIEIVALEI